MKKSTPQPMSDRELIALGVKMREAQKAYFACPGIEESRKKALLDESKLLEYKFDLLAKDSHDPTVMVAIEMRRVQKEYFVTPFAVWRKKQDLLLLAKGLEATFDRLASNQPDPQTSLAFGD